MLSTKYRLRLQGICEKIERGDSVDLSDMIWAEKLGKANTTAREMLRSLEGLLRTQICKRGDWMIL